jgi:Domain of unknown function (DUF4440)
MPPPTDHAQLGRRFVEAIAAKDPDALASVLSPDVLFTGMTPSRSWEAADPPGVTEIVFGSWFEPHDHVQEIVEVRVEPWVDRTRITYRLRVDSDGEPCLVEQYGYFDAVDGRMSRVQLVCSGFLHDPSAPGEDIADDPADGS